MNKLLSMILVYIILVSTTQAETDNASGWYLGAGYGLSRLKPDTRNTGFSVSNSNDFAVKVFAGYDWSERVRAEAYYADLGKADISPFGNVEYQDYGVSGLYYFRDRQTIHDDWIAFGKLGVGRMENDSDLPYRRVNDTHILFGAGFEYGINRHLNLRVELEFFEKDAQFLSINLLRRFGHEK